MSEGAIIVDVREREAVRNLLEHRMREAEKRRREAHSYERKAVESARIDEVLSVYLLLLGKR